MMATIHSFPGKPKHHLLQALDNLEALNAYCHHPWPALEASPLFISLGEAAERVLSRLCHARTGDAA
jgi:hypothetical protein